VVHYDCVLHLFPNSYWLLYCHSESVFLSLDFSVFLLDYNQSQIPFFCLCHSWLHCSQSHTPSLCCQSQFPSFMSATVSYIIASQPFCFMPSEVRLHVRHIASPSSPSFNLCYNWLHHSPSFPSFSPSHTWSHHNQS